VTKLSAEQLCFLYYKNFGVPTVSLRFFTVYGPRNRPDMMAYKVLDNIFFGREVALYNQGQMYRDWTYAGDVAAGECARQGLRLDRCAALEPGVGDAARE
jgi:nucleoside-diphosphate-sugar epimerase